MWRCWELRRFDFAIMLMVVNEKKKSFACLVIVAPPKCRYVVKWWTIVACSVAWPFRMVVMLLIDNCISQRLSYMLVAHRFCAKRLFQGLLALVVDGVSSSWVFDAVHLLAGGHRNPQWCAQWQFLYTASCEPYPISAAVDGSSLCSLVLGLNTHTGSVVRSCCYGIQLVLHTTLFFSIGLGIALVQFGCNSTVYQPALCWRPFRIGDVFLFGFLKK